MGKTPMERLGDWLSQHVWPGVWLLIVLAVIFFLSGGAPIDWGGPDLP